MVEPKEELTDTWMAVMLVDQKVDQWDDM